MLMISEEDDAWGFDGFDEFHAMDGRDAIGIDVGLFVGEDPTSQGAELNPVGPFGSIVPSGDIIHIHLSVVVGIGHVFSSRMVWNELEASNRNNDTQRGLNMPCIGKRKGSRREGGLPVLQINGIYLNCR